MGVLCPSLLVKVVVAIELLSQLYYRFTCITSLLLWQPQRYDYLPGILDCLEIGEVVPDVGGRSRNRVTLASAPVYESQESSAYPIKWQGLGQHFFTCLNASTTLRWAERSLKIHGRKGKFSWHLPRLFNRYNRTMREVTDFTPNSMSPPWRLHPLTGWNIVSESMRYVP